MERVLTPPPIVRYYRCADCSDRYPAIGLFEHRFVVRQETQALLRWGAGIVIFAGIIAALIGFVILR